MFRLVALAAALASGAVNAQEACSPTYQVKFATCVNANSPTRVMTVTSDWILVNKGARRISNGLCTDHIATLAAQDPKRSNIQFVDIKDEDATQRGVGKRDVYCKFSWDAPVKIPVADESCGIIGVERVGCFDDVSADLVDSCKPGDSDSLAESWRKAGCLLDVYQNARKMNGMTSAVYEDVKFQLSYLRDHGPVGVRAYIGVRYK